MWVGGWLGDWVVMWVGARVGGWVVGRSGGLVGEYPGWKKVKVKEKCEG